MASKAISTRITKLFGCKYPIILPGMSWISKPRLVAAVSNAGGVGILATGPLNPTETRDAIREIRRLTDQPFGIGATLLMPGAAENAKVALEEQVPIVNVSLGKAEWIAEGLAQYGGKLLATVTTTKHAKAALETGADAFMVTGHEAAAHGGDVTSLVLVPSIAEQFPDVPIVAAGGFANGRGLVAALSLGADAVAMGSRMAVTQESPLAQATKEAIVRAAAHDTLYGSNFDGIAARVLKTPAAERAMQSRPWLPVVVYRSFQAARKLGIPLWKVIPGLVIQWQKMFVVAQFGAATEAIMAATVHGDVKGKGVQFVGQCQSMIDDIPEVDNLVQRIVREAVEVSRKQQHVFLESDDGSGLGQDKTVLGTCNDSIQEFIDVKPETSAASDHCKKPSTAKEESRNYGFHPTPTTTLGSMPTNQMKSDCFRRNDFPNVDCNGRVLRLSTVTSLPQPSFRQQHGRISSNLLDLSGILVPRGGRSFHVSLMRPVTESDTVLQEDQSQSNHDPLFDANEVSYSFTSPPELSHESRQKVDALFKKILWLDMIEVHLLTQMVNEKLGISWKETEQGFSSAAGVVKTGAAGSDSGAEGQAAELKTVFDLKLIGYDAKAKIKVIKEIRSIAGLGLKEAKDLVEGAPKVVQKQLKQDKAEELKAQLEAAGAEVELV
ncbi:enoyl-acyl-carrier-protein reductase II [Nitzschia inconspicua]|uniref:Enoyl-acyl-carrier-protein reductase II n=1 Tax=Nitzschia inconspicua TaxID=303405 RepID=A0A9K3LN00_9STRA|nr:enoyl-acyl-carrier-protein reductase II [Nitzschia inconspicua]